MISFRLGLANGLPKESIGYYTGLGQQILIKLNHNILVWDAIIITEISLWLQIILTELYVAENDIGRHLFG